MDECGKLILHIGTDLRVRAQGRAIAPFGASQAGQEHHGALEHDALRDGTPSLAVEGPTTARVFETYVEEVLVPSLHTRQIVVMDNLEAHRPKRIGQLIERQGCELLYLPAPTPPTTNPIEEAFAKLKQLLRKLAAARSKEALVEAIGAALSAITTADTKGFFEHAGYRPAGQLP